MSTRAEILEQLKAVGVGYVVIEFNGEGDSGSVSAAQLYVRHKEKDLENVTSKHVDIADALTELCETELDETDIDWYNNGGGFGTYIIDLDHNKFKFQVYTRWVEESMEHDEKGSIKAWAANKTENEI